MSDLESKVELSAPDERPYTPDEIIEYLHNVHKAAMSAFDAPKGELLEIPADLFHFAKELYRAALDLPRDLYENAPQRNGLAALNEAGMLTNGDHFYTVGTESSTISSMVNISGPSTGNEPYLALDIQETKGKATSGDYVILKTFIPKDGSRFQIMLYDQEKARHFVADAGTSYLNVFDTNAAEDIMSKYRSKSLSPKQIADSMLGAHVTVEDEQIRFDRPLWEWVDMDSLDALCSINAVAVDIENNVVHKEGVRNEVIAVGMKNGSLKVDVNPKWYPLYQDHLHAGLSSTMDTDNGFTQAIVGYNLPGDLLLSDAQLGLSQIPPLVRGSGFFQGVEGIDILTIDVLKYLRQTVPHMGGYTLRQMYNLHTLGHREFSLMEADFADFLEQSQNLPESGPWFINKVLPDTLAHKFLFNEVHEELAYLSLMTGENMGTVSQTSMYRWTNGVWDTTGRKHLQLKHDRTAQNVSERDLIVHDAQFHAVRGEEFDYLDIAMHYLEPYKQELTAGFFDEYLLHELGALGATRRVNIMRNTVLAPVVYALQTLADNDISPEDFAQLPDDSTIEAYTGSSPTKAKQHSTELGILKERFSKEFGIDMNELIGRMARQDAEQREGNYISKNSVSAFVQGFQDTELPSLAVKVIVLNDYDTTDRAIVFRPDNLHGSQEEFYSVGVNLRYAAYAPWSRNLASRLLSYVMEEQGNIHQKGVESILHEANQTLEQGIKRARNFMVNPPMHQGYVETVPEDMQDRWLLFLEKDGDEVIMPYEDFTMMAPEEQDEYELDRTHYVESMHGALFRKVIAPICRTAGISVDDYNAFAGRYLPNIMTPVQLSQR